MTEPNVTAFKTVPASSAATPASDTPPAVAFPTGSTPGEATRPDEAHTPADATQAAARAEKFVDRVVQGAHQAIDGLAAKASAKIDTVGDGASRITGAKDEWIGAAREAIRERPFAAMGVALLIGAAYISLRSSRSR